MFSRRSPFSRRSTHAGMPTKLLRALPIFLASLVVGVTASPAAATFSASFDLSAPGQDAFYNQVAVDADGDAVFIWARSDGTNLRVQARARSAAGVLSPVQTLSRRGVNANYPRVGVDADGDAVFTWERSRERHYDRVKARARTAAGVLSPVQTLSAPGQRAFEPQVAVDPAGDAVVTWRRYDGTNLRVQGAVGP